MSLLFDNVCKECGKSFSSWDAVPLCADCYSDEKRDRLLAQMRQEDHEFQQQRNNPINNLKIMKTPPATIRAIGVWSVRVLLIVCAVIAGFMDKKELAEVLLVPIIFSFVLLDDD